MMLAQKKRARAEERFVLLGGWGKKAGQGMKTVIYRAQQQDSYYTHCLIRTRAAQKMIYGPPSSVVVFVCQSHRPAEDLSSSHNRVNVHEAPPAHTASYERTQTSQSALGEAAQPDLVTRSHWPAKDSSSSRNGVKAHEAPPAHTASYERARASWSAHSEKRIKGENELERMTKHSFWPLQARDASEPANRQGSCSFISSSSAAIADRLL